MVGVGVRSQSNGSRCWSRNRLACLIIVEAGSRIPKSLVAVKGGGIQSRKACVALIGLWCRSRIARIVGVRVKDRSRKIQTVNRREELESNKTRQLHRPEFAIYKFFSSKFHSSILSSLFHIGYYKKDESLTFLIEHFLFQV